MSTEFEELSIDKLKQQLVELQGDLANKPSARTMELLKSDIAETQQRIETLEKQARESAHAALASEQKFERDLVSGARRRHG